MNKRCRLIREPEGPRALFKGRAGQGPTIFADTRMDRSRSITACFEVFTIDTEAPVNPAPAPARLAPALPPVDPATLPVRTPMENMCDLTTVLFSTYEPQRTGTKIYCAEIFRDRMVPVIGCEPEFARLLKTLQERQDAESAIKAVKGGDHKAALRELEESNDRLLTEITKAIRAKIV